MISGAMFKQVFRSRFLRYVIFLGGQRFAQLVTILLPISAQLLANYELPNISDPRLVPMTFLEQERAMVLRELRNHPLKGNETILHLGCRNGYLTKEIAEYIPQGHLIGLENTYEENPQTELLNLIFMQGTLEDQEWESVFDCVICTQFDECGLDANYCIPMIERALKPSGFAIVLQCIDMALPEANPLKEWLRRPENQKYVEYLQFWYPIPFKNFRSLVTKQFTYPSGEFSVPIRMIACFKDEEIFKNDAKKWFRKIDTLEPLDRDICLDYLFETMKNSTMLLPYENEHRRMYYFLYNLELASFSKKTAEGLL